MSMNAAAGCAWHQEAPNASDSIRRDKRAKACADRAAWKLNRSCVANLKTNE
jgi:hypothetical protein